MKIQILFLTFSTFLYVTDAAKILAIFPAHSYSHFVIGDVLTKELAKRGHEVTVIASFKSKTPIENYNFVELIGAEEFMQEQLKDMDFNYFGFQDINKFLMAVIMSDFGYEITKFFYENENTQKLMKSNNKYDLIIMEQFFNEGVYGVCSLFKAPCIAVSAVGSMNWNNRLTGNIGLSSYVPDMSTPYSQKMSFFERLHNLALLVFEEIIFHYHTTPKMNRLVHELIPEAPHLYDLMSNVSMVFLNSHPALSAPVPLTPNMIELGGIHVEGLKDKKLSSDVQSFLDEHNEGVIYFALGSNAKSKDMPKKPLQEVIKAFKKWGKPILWKYEEELPEKVDNIKTGKWFPQIAVLAHKNVIAFITHCGRLSSLESLYYGVPMIGLPLFAEQTHNAAEMVLYGYAITLEFQNIKAEDMYNALVDITTNPKYSQEAKVRSRAFRKRNALEEAVYWAEHVIEFNGASYLKNAAVDLPWYQLWMVDVIVFSIVAFGSFNAILFYFIVKMCSCKAVANKKNVSIRKKKN